MKDRKIIYAWDKLSPSDDEKLRIMEKVREGQELNRRRRVSVKSLLIAVIIMAVTAMGVAAYSSEIQRLILGNSVAVEVETIVGDYLYSFAIGVKGYDGEQRTINLNPQNFRLYSPSLNLFERFGEDYRLFPFVPSAYHDFLNNWDGDITVQELNNSTMFTVKEPMYIPNFRRELQQRVSEQPAFISLLRWDEREDAVGVVLTYNTIAPLGSGNWYQAFSFAQWYVGEGGYFEVVATAPISKIIIGDTEAVLIENVIADGEGVIEPRQGAEVMKQRELIWLRDGIVYSMTSFESIEGFASISLAMKILIAESIH